MAKRKQEDSTLSFIDILSGALGGVLIIFVIIPKQLHLSDGEDKKRRGAKYVKGQKNTYTHKEKRVGLEKQEEQTEERTLTHGFRFNGRKLLFIYDRYSTDPLENKKVKATVNLMVSSLNPKYHLDVVAVPSQEKVENFEPIIGQLNPVENFTVEKINIAVQAMNDLFSSPLDHIQMRQLLDKYPEATDIIIFTQASNIFQTYPPDLYMSQIKHRPVTLSFVVIQERNIAKKRRQAIKKRTEPVLKKGGFVTVI